MPSRFSSWSWEEYRPSQLRFTHSSIKTDFQDGYSLEETLESIVSGRLRVSEMQPMVVMQYRGRPYVVYGNRRLYLYQKLEKHGHLGKVKVKEVAFETELFNKMHTTTNEGKSVQCRGSNAYQVDRRLESILKNRRSRTSSYDVVLGGMGDLTLEEDSPSPRRQPAATYVSTPVQRDRVPTPPRTESSEGLGGWEIAALVAGSLVLLGTFIFRRN